MTRKGSAAAQSVIDRLRHKVIKDAEEINDSLLGLEMTQVQGNDDTPVAASSCNPSALETQSSVLQADTIDFYSPERLPVDVSFLEFDPQTPPNEILLQFQRLNSLYACALMLHADLCVSCPSLPAMRWFLTKNSIAVSSRARHW